MAEVSQSPLMSDWPQQVAALVVEQVQANLTNDAEIWRLKTVIQKTGMSESEIYRLQKIGEFPRGVKYGGNKTGWNSQSVQSWIDDVLTGSYGQAC